MSASIPVQTNGNGQAGWDAPAPALADQISALSGERPEIAVAAAFLGGIILARIIRRLAR